MVVMILERVPRGLRGELSSWLMEVQPGVFVGKVSALVRDLLWEKCVLKSAGGKCCQIWSTDNEQGFMLRLSGDSNRRVVELDGLFLVSVQRKKKSRGKKDLKGDDM